MYLLEVQQFQTFYPINKLLISFPPPNNVHFKLTSAQRITLFHGTFLGQATEL